MTPFSSVAILEKLALLRIAFCKAPVFSTASLRRTSVMTSTVPAARRSASLGDSSGVFMDLIGVVLTSSIITFLFAEMRTEAKKKDGRANGIEARDKRYERNAQPAEKTTYVFQGIPLSCTLKSKIPCLIRQSYLFLHREQILSLI